MSKNNGLFSLNNIVISLKAIGTSIVSSISLAVLGALIMFSFRNGNLAFGFLLTVFTFLLSIFFWGFLANKFWGWK